MDDGQQVMGKTHSSLGSGEQKISFSFPKTIGTFI
jgi:hypothetical protein